MLTGGALPCPLWAFEVASSSKRVYVWDVAAEKVPSSTAVRSMVRSGPSCLSKRMKRPLHLDGENEKQRHGRHTQICIV